MAWISRFPWAVVPGLVLIGTLAACGGGGAGDSPPAASAPAPGVAPSQPVARAVPESDLDIARRVYAGAARTPEGFYQEPQAPWTGQVTTAHLKNGDLETLAEGEPRRELCTDDWNEALAWSEQAAARLPAASDLVETGGNERWFEFTRALRTVEPSYSRQRVFRCAYLDRSGVDLDRPSGHAGRLNVRPLDAAALALASEYLWQFTSFNNFGHAVLASRAAGAGREAPAHEIVIASLRRAEAATDCDEIAVHAWTHAADATNGALTLDDRLLWRFAARERAGVIELCAG